MRLADNPALAQAAARGAVVPVFLHPASPAGASLTYGALGGASQVWLHHALLDFDAALRGIGSALVVRQTDDPVAELARIVAECGATAIYYDHCVEPLARILELRVEMELGQRLEVRGWNANLLLAPGQILNGQGEPFRVFTPFWKAACRQLGMLRLAATPTRLRSPSGAPGRPLPGLEIEALGLMPAHGWPGTLLNAWDMSAAGGERRWRGFTPGAIENYGEARDIPGTDGTSKLSPYLHFGQVSPKQLWNEVLLAQGQTHAEGLPEGPRRFLAELGWREFSHQLLFHFPHTLTEPLNHKFAAFPWDNDPRLLRCWQRGQTGYPIVDAGMRQLWATGWMHNRVRMIVGSFLVKHLLLPWQEGERWFWDTLVDADAAANTLGWQWVAGCGADAAPYFRVFNPILQGAKFDPEGDYVRAWVPELASVPRAFIHAPWEYGLFRSVSYPEPVVDHATARARALAAFSKIKAGD
jgi:deoxyribodipyrimidine photo-lyase